MVSEGRGIICPVVAVGPFLHFLCGGSSMHVGVSMLGIVSPGVEVDLFWYFLCWGSSMHVHVVSM